MTVVQIERRKIEFLVPIDIPSPKYRIGQLVEVFSAKDWQNPDIKCWFPCRVTGMAWDTDQGENPRWQYLVKFLNCDDDSDPFEWVHDDENIWLLEDY